MATLDPNWECVIVEKEVDRTASSVDFTFAGFGTPTFVIVLWGQSNPGASLRYADWSNISFGVYAPGGAQWSVAAASQSSASTSNCSSGQQSGFCVGIPTYGSTGWAVRYQATNIANGIRLTKNVNSQATDKIVQVMMFKGASIKNVNVGNFNANGATSQVLNGGGGWQPNYAIFATAGYVAASGYQADARFGIGWAVENVDGVATGTFKQGSMATISRDALTTTQTGSILTDSKCMSIQHSTGVQQMTGSGFSSTGINYTETCFTNCFVHYIALELEQNLTTDPDMCIERLSNWVIDEANGNVLSKVGMTAKDNNFCGAIINIGTSVSAKSIDDRTSSYVGVGRISIKDPLGTHGGMTWADQDAVTTTNTGGSMQGPYSWWMETFDGGGKGNKEWEGIFYDKEYGGELKLLSTTYGSGYYEPFTLLTWGRGVREMYAGSTMISPYQTGVTNRCPDVYAGGIKLHGDPTYDNP